MRLVLVEWENVARVWPEIERWVALALRRSVGYQPVDILTALMRGELQLWLAVDTDIRACAVTRIDRYPRARVCFFLIVGGEGIDDWIGLEGGIAEWARAIGCVAMEGPGRRGWERKMQGHGYEPVFTIVRKVLR